MARKTRKSSLKFDGVEELQKKLKSLPKSLRQKAAREATRRAVDAVLHEARANLHRAPAAYRTTLADGTTITRQPGELAEVLTMQRVKKEDSPSYLSMHRTVFLRHVNHGIGSIAHFLEYGVSEHEITTASGKTYMHGGHEDYPFLRPAVRKQKPVMYRLIKDVLSDGIREELDLNK